LECNATVPPAEAVLFDADIYGELLSTAITASRKEQAQSYN
jgi:hypothetical protein